MSTTSPRLRQWCYHSLEAAGLFQGRSCGLCRAAFGFVASEALATRQEPGALTRGLQVGLKVPLGLSVNLEACVAQDRFKVSRSKDLW